MELEKEHTILHIKDNIDYTCSGFILKQLEQIGVPLKTKRRIFLITDECLSNIYTHRDPNETTEDTFIPEFTIQEKENVFLLTTKNTIENRNIKYLSEKLEWITHSNDEQIKKMIRVTLTDGKFTNKGGGGLGMLYIAKISGGDILYVFEQINDNYSYFIFQIKVSK